MIKKDVKIFSVDKINGMGWSDRQEVDIAINGCVIPAKLSGRTETGGLAFDFKFSDVIEVADNLKAIDELGWAFKSK
jgi:hypothetical protein